MNICRYTKTNDVAALQNSLQKNFLPSDTWGIIEVHTAPDQAEKDFREAISSPAAEKEQKTFEQLAQQFPEKYGYIVPSDSGKIHFSVFPTASGTKILFVTTYAQKPLKKIFTSKTMGTGMKIHTAKIKNRFEPTNWKRASWFFVAYALTSGNDNDFATVSRFG